MGNTRLYNEEQEPGLLSHHEGFMHLISQTPGKKASLCIEESLGKTLRVLSCHQKLSDPADATAAQLFLAKKKKNCYSDQSSKLPSILI